MQYTINIFKNLISRLPPLFPAESADSAAKYCAQCASVEDAEHGLIALGYAVWPYQKAHRNFWQSIKAKMGEHFLLPKLSAQLKTKIDNWRAHGLRFDHIVSGATADYFNSDERVELSAAISATDEELRDYVNRDIVSFSKQDYVAQVAQYQQILEAIKEKITELKNLSARVGDHEMLANEITERVRLFEHGLCDLAPEPTVADICAAIDHFNGRCHDLNRRRGIHVPVEVDFYGVN